MKKVLLSVLGFSPLLSLAQEAEPVTSSAFSNALFNTMLGVIIFLLIMIVALAHVLKNISLSDIILKKDKDKEGNNNGIKAAGIILFALLGFDLSAQTNHSWMIGGLTPSIFYFMLSIIIIETIFLAVLIHTIKFLLKSEGAKTKALPEKKEKSILDILNASVEIEKEAEIMIGHEYDGIRELDNDLPPWWRYGFYLTILVAIVYLINYHIAKTGDLQLAEYQKEMEKGKAEVEEYMKQSAANVDENTVKMLSGGDLENGKSIFIANCATCHGKQGEGNVGPNLTDDYWLHEGKLKDIFKSIKYGWTDKGMKSWKEDLSPMQIAQVTSFIKSLRGTNPPNAKAPQGDLSVEKESADSLSVKSDSLQVKAISDTLKAAPANK